MHSWHKLNKIFIVSLLSLSFTLETQVLAAVSTQDELTQYEKLIFGQANTDLSQEARLKALETNLIGSPQTGSTEKRLNSIRQTIAGHSKLLPPIAPQLDTSNINKGIEKAPSYINDNAYVSEPVSDEEKNSEIVKGMLRDALQKHASGQSTQAENILLKAAKISPNNTDVFYNLGAISEGKGNLKKAFDYYQKALAINPNDSEIRDAVNAVDLKLKAQHSVAISEQQVSQLKQLANNASAAYKSGNYNLAISTLERIQSQNPNDPSVYYGLGQAWRAKGDNAKARQYLSQAVQMAPDNELYRSSLTALGSSPARNNDIANAPQSIPYTPYMDTYNSNSDNSPVGDITPFAPTPSSRGSSIVDNFGSGGGFISQAIPFLGGLGAASMFNRGGYGYAPVSSGSRIKRIVTASLAGAAIGALTGRGRPGGVKSGAMKGAMYGGLVGLITGF